MLNVSANLVKRKKTIYTTVKLYTVHQVLGVY